MKNRILGFLLIFISAFLFAFNSYGQDFKKVLGKPEKFDRPVDLQGQALVDFMNDKTGPKMRKPWIVVCDRDGVETYTDASATEKSGKKLEFRDHFFVVDEDDKYIHLMKMNGYPNANLTISKGSYTESYGWVEKSKMLLWTSGLRSSKTGIYLKSLILYTVEGANKVIENNASAIKIKKSPNRGAETIGDVSLYDFYFILKKENGYYLLGKENELLESDFKTKILGWVEEIEQADWNTRLSLEQNFTKAAYEERKLRPNVQFVAFTDEINARNQALLGNGDPKKILTRDDPVNAKGKVLGKDKRRFIGTKLRMPVLRAGDNFFSTGVLGSVGNKGSNDCPACQKAYDEISQFSNNYNILFIVESTTAMREYKDEMINALGNLKRGLTDVPNVKFGIVFYRNAHVSGKSFIDITPLSNEIDIIGNKIRSTAFTETSYDGYSTMYSALSKASAKVGFGANSTNIIYVIGQNPDFRDEPTMKLNCIDDGCDAYVRENVLVDQLSNLRAHLIFIQPKLPKEFIDNGFREQASNIMLETSKGNFKSYKKINNLLKDQKEVNPEIIDEVGQTYISGGSTKNVFFTSDTGMSDSQFSSHIRSSFNDIKNKQRAVAQVLENLFEYGQGLDEANEITGSDFDAEALKDKLNSVLVNAGLELTKENLDKLTDRKVNLYIQAYVPKRIYGADHDLCSPVLFFPARELGDYMEELRRIAALKNEEEHVLRTQLKTALITLFNKYAGNKKSSKATMEDLVNALVGEGFDIVLETSNFKLKNIDNPRVKIETIRSFVNEIDNTYRGLEAMTKDNSYEYKFRTKSGGLRRNTYYWIDFADTWPLQQFKL